jgi:integrase
MAKSKKFTADDLDKALRSAPGLMHPVGGSLYVYVRRPGVGYWKGRYRVGKALRTHSLGRAGNKAPHVTPAKAIVDWADYLSARRNGTLPLATAEARGKMAAAPVVESAGERYRDAVSNYIERKSVDWMGGALGGNAANYRNDVDLTLPDGRSLGSLVHAEITDAIIQLVVRSQSARTAHDTVPRIKAVRRFMQDGYVRLDHKVEHLEAMDWRELPDFYAKVPFADVRGRAIAFTILTACRINNVVGHKKNRKRGAVWGDIDADNVWTIPKELMKNGEEHSVPLSSAALELLGSRGAPDALLFPELHYGYFKVNRLREKLTTDTLHGFRSSFRSWCQKNRVDMEVAEMCMSHKIGTSAQLAYKREALLEARQALMEQWAAHCVSGKTGEGA